MTPYIIIATMHTYQETGINSCVMSHGLKTSMEDAVDFVRIICEAQHFTELDCDFISNDGHLTTYIAQAYHQRPRLGRVRHLEGEGNRMLTISLRTMYYIELNAMIVRGYASLKRAEALYQKYAQNPDNLVRILERRRSYQGINQ